MLTKINIKMIAIVTICLMLPQISSGERYQDVVENKRKADVTADNKIDFEEEAGYTLQRVSADEVEVDGKIASLYTKAFKPPRNRTFEVFSQTGDRSDIWSDPATTKAFELVSGLTYVRCKGIYNINKVGNFPIKCEGNLARKSSGGTGGTKTPEELLAHWSVEVEKPQTYDPKVKITEVPEYLYSRATYYVPIRFEITGLGKNVDIKHNRAVQAVAYMTIKNKEHPIEVEGVIPGQGYKTKKGHDPTNKFTAWVNPLNLPELKKEDSIDKGIKWRIKVHAAKANDLAIVYHNISSKIEDYDKLEEKKKTYRFYSHRFEVIEITEADTNSYTKIHSRYRPTYQRDFQFPGKCQFKYLNSDGDASSHGGKVGKVYDFTQKNVKIMENAGFEKTRLVTKNVDEADVSVYALLRDNNESGDWENDETFTLMGGGVQRKMYFGVSYGPRNIVDLDWPGMVLDDTQGRLHFKPDPEEKNITALCEAGTSEGEDYTWQAWKTVGKYALVAGTAVAAVVAPELLAIEATISKAILKASVKLAAQLVKDQTGLGTVKTDNINSFGAHFAWDGSLGVRKPKGDSSYEKLTNLFNKTGEALVYNFKKKDQRQGYEFKKVLKLGTEQCHGVVGDTIYFNLNVWASCTATSWVNNDAYADCYGIIRGVEQIQIQIRSNK